ncbi:hypothetical protein BSKO_04996 [Bryopsis sp. KO-2023]|nr:hypothetical protein BSKO_04996 [Bryopsis sp. KO-2023]
MSGGGHGGLCGFELEAYRQECLRKFFGVTTPNKPPKYARTKSSVQFDGPMSSFSLRNERFCWLPDPMRPSSRQPHEDIRAILSRSAKERAVGVRTEYGIPEVQPYDIISGLPSQPRRYLAPPYGAHAMRIPVYLMGEEFQDEALENDDECGAAEDRLPTPTAAGVAGPQRLSSYQFLSAEHALNPPGSSDPGQRAPSRGHLYSSHRSLMGDRGKHFRNPLHPNQILSRPRTSSQETGWHCAQMYQNQYQDYGKKCCRETRFAHSIITGPRTIHGHGGQLTL